MIRLSAKLVRGRVVISVAGVSKIIGTVAACPCCGALAFEDSPCRS